jgi:hypothetical protein
MKIPAAATIAPRIRIDCEISVMSASARFGAHVPQPRIWAADERVCAPPNSAAYFRASRLAGRDDATKPPAKLPATV